MRKIVFTLCVFVLIATIMGTAYAFDGVATGNVGTIHVTDGQNCGFRMVFVGGQNICNNHNWAYINDTDSNYKIYIATILQAKAMNLPVTLYVTKEASGYCHIVYMEMQ